MLIHFICQQGEPLGIISQVLLQYSLKNMHTPAGQRLNEVIFLPLMAVVNSFPPQSVGQGCVNADADCQ